MEGHKDVLGMYVGENESINANINVYRKSKINMYKS